VTSGLAAPHVKHVVGRFQNKRERRCILVVVDVDTHFSSKFLPYVERQITYFFHRNDKDVLYSLRRRTVNKILCVNIIILDQRVCIFSVSFFSGVDKPMLLLAALVEIVP